MQQHNVKEFMICNRNMIGFLPELIFLMALILFVDVCWCLYEQNRKFHDCVVCFWVIIDKDYKGFVGNNNPWIYLLCIAFPFFWKITAFFSITFSWFVFEGHFYNFRLGKKKKKKTKRKFDFGIWIN